MKHKLIIIVVAVIIVFVIFLVLLSRRTSDAQVWESYTSHTYSNNSEIIYRGIELPDRYASEYTSSMVNEYAPIPNSISTVEEPYHYKLLHLRPINELESCILESVQEQVGHLMNIRGFTYFDFIGDGDFSPVIFAESVYPRNGNPDLIIRDSIIIAKIDTHVYYTWLAIGESWIDVVVPLTHFDWDNLISKSSLLVVVSHPSGFNSVFILAFNGNKLHSYELFP